MVGKCELLGEGDTKIFEGFDAFKGVPVVSEDRGGCG